MCENPAVAERWEADRFANVILPDGETREVRVVEGHLFVCEGCCCGNADKGVPEVPRAAFKKEWKERGIRRTSSPLDFAVASDPARWPTS